MASKYWLKLFYEIIDDPKMGRLPDNLWRRFIELLCIAGEYNRDGRLPAIHDIAWRLRTEEEALRIEFDQMSRIGLIDFINAPLDEHWIVTNFAKRQEAQSASERGKLFRKRQRKQYYYEPETVTERKPNVSFADKDKDKDKDKDAAFAAVSTHYLNNIGDIATTMRDKLELAIEDFPVDWIIEAIDISVEQNKRSWAYAHAILRRWKSDGKSSGKKQSSVSEMLDKAGL